MEPRRRDVVAGAALIAFLRQVVGESTEFDANVLVNEMQSF